MIGRVRVIMTQLGMERFSEEMKLGYLISKKENFVYILKDDSKTITRYNRAFWKAYHVEESHFY